MKYMILMSMSIVVAYASDGQKNVPHIKVDHSEPVAIPHRRTSQNNSPRFIELHDFSAWSPSANPAGAILMNALSAKVGSTNNSPFASTH